MIYFLNCATMRPYLPRIEAATLCLLVETNDGLVLVDTGFGLRDYSHPSRLMRNFTALLRARCNAEECAVRQVARLGFDPREVKHIFLTHLHLDHAGGLPDFPDSQVHLYRPEYEAAMHPKSFIEHFYIPAQWEHAPKWVLHTLQGQRWFDIDCVQIEGISPNILLIPLAGHTQGHCGVAIETKTGWLLHCGDAAPFIGSPLPVPEWVAPAVVGNWMPTLRDFAHQHAGEVSILPSHMYLTDFCALQAMV